MSREEELNFRVTADTKQAATNVDDLKSDVSDLEDKPHDVEVTADTAKAEAAAKQLDKRLDGLTDEQKRIVLEVAAKDAQRDLDRLNRDLAQAHKFGDDEIAIKLSARGDAQAKLQAIQAEARELDSVDPTVEVKVKGGEQIRALFDDLDSRTGGFASKLGALGVGSPAVAGVAAIAGGLLLAAQHSAQMAIDADNLAKLTGDSVENASRLNAVWKTTGADTKDLQDVLLQMNGVLATNAELAEQLGINLNDGATIGQRFEQVAEALDKIPDAAQRSQLASQLFGEEGVRQYNALKNAVGDVGEAMANLPEGQVFTEEDAKRARELAAEIAQMKLEFEGLAAEIGNEVIPVLGDLAEFLSEVRDKAGEAKSAIEDIPGGGSLLDALGTNIFELPKKSKAEWDELGRKIGVVPDELDRAIVPADRLRSILEATGPAAADAAGGVEDLGDGSTFAAQALQALADSGFKTKDPIDALISGVPVADQVLRDLGKTARNDTAPALDAVANAAAGVATALQEGFADARDQLRQEGLFDEIADQLGRIDQAQQKINDADTDEDAAAARRDHADQVRQLRSLVLDLLDTYKDVPVQKQTEILALINDGSLASAKSALDELTHGGFIPVEIVPTVRPGFDSANIALGRGSIPSLSFAPPQVVSQSTTINNFPTGTSAEAQFANTKIFRRRGGR